jgi:uncharacterized membrane protein
MARGETGKGPSGDQRISWPLEGHPFYLAIAALGLIGLGLASYLTYLDYTGVQDTFCQEGSGCDAVHQSEYANLLGIPVALWGVIGYAAIIATALVPLSYRLRRPCLFGLATAGFAFSVHLTYLELFVIHDICPYCMASASTMTVIFILMMARRPTAPGIPWPRLNVLGWLCQRRWPWAWP